MFNTTFNNISAISWRSILLVEETGVSGENYQLVAGHSQTVSHNVVLRTPRLSEIRAHNYNGVGTDCIGSCKTNYDAITTTSPEKKITQIIRNEKNLIYYKMNLFLYISEPSKKYQKPQNLLSFHKLLTRSQKF